MVKKSLKAYSNNHTTINAKKKAKGGQKMAEAYPQVGANYSDYGWTNLTADVSRDLQPIVQDRMQDIAFFLYDSNPLAHRTIEMTTDFVIGDGFTYTAEDDKVKEVLDKHWNDPVNNWALKQTNKCKELAIFGEQFYPVFVNPYSGHVRLGFIDPGAVKKIVVNRKNPEVVDSVILKTNDYSTKKPRRLKVVNPIRKKGSKDNGLYDGEILVFYINKVTSTSRGRSDLLPLADWIDGYDQFLFARLERANILNNFVWDVLLEGADEATINDWLAKQSTPKPGSIRAHNEKVTWSSVVPDLQSQDASKEANLFKMQILGGAGFPNLWFGEGGEGIRAAAQEMSLPTMKHLRSRQRYFKYMITHVFDFVIDQAIMAGTLDRKVNRSFEVITPILTKEKEMTMGMAAYRVTESISIALEKKWINEDQAKESWQTFMKDIIGLDIKTVEEKETENETD